MELSLVLFFIGFAILIYSARLLVRGAASIATILNITPWVIGVVIVGIGTSIPELSISISAALAGNNIGLGTIIGSNTFNLLFILGLAALFSPLYIKEEWYEDIFINIVAVIIGVLVIFLPLLGDRTFFGLTRAEGALLFGFFILWLFLMFRRKGIRDDGIDYQILASFTSVIFIIVGLAGVFLGGEWVVSGAETLALLFSVPPAIIGLTVVAVGTSLPELTVSLVALLQKKNSIAVGNIIGSNIFDFLGILGITALIKPLMVLEKVGIDALTTLAATIIIAILIFAVGKRGMLSRAEGVILILSYIAYLVFIFLNM
ncbi:calcium/sodium antiporter [Candidatus Kaiserbacteria bacterium]|nr:calcium/sodium antiporter [Candidatus Kaiserbacteria bacterium]